MREHILDQDLPGLTRKVRALSGERQRQILIRAAKFAAEKAGDLDPQLLSVLHRLEAGWMPSIEEAKSIMTMADATDDRYFELLNSGLTEEQWGKDFSSARLLRGIAVGFGASSREDIVDAIYEIVKSLRDPSDLLSLVTSELELPSIR
jgi:hypothetical protein